MKDTKASLHWWYQRLTAIFLIPLTIWFLYIINNAVSILKNKNSTILEIFQFISIKYPFTTLIINIILILHIRMGMQEVIEDYVHTEKTKLVCIIFLNVLTVRMITEVLVYLYI